MRGPRAVGRRAHDDRPTVRNLRDLRLGGLQQRARGATLQRSGQQRSAGARSRPVRRPVGREQPLPGQADERGACPPAYCCEARTVSLPVP
ncbi:hypothetical protein [Streptomyces sp. NBC_00203]|uniref:hypothetical protein n=1 Tax=Streptomyces sp. NBC_00203 TaxID=2975680 RepID=UPI00325008BF